MLALIIPLYLILRVACLGTRLPVRCVTCAVAIRPQGS